MFLPSPFKSKYDKVTVDEGCTDEPQKPGYTYNHTAGEYVYQPFPNMRTNFNAQVQRTNDGSKNEYSSNLRGFTKHYLRTPLAGMPPVTRTVTFPNIGEVALGRKIGSGCMRRAWECNYQDGNTPYVVKEARDDVRTPEKARGMNIAEYLLGQHLDCMPHVADITTCGTYMLVEEVTPLDRIEETEDEYAETALEQMYAHIHDEYGLEFTDKHDGNIGRAVADGRVVVIDAYFDEDERDYLLRCLDDVDGEMEYATLLREAMLKEENGNMCALDINDIGWEEDAA